MRALEFITGHVIFKLGYNQIYQLCTFVQWKDFHFLFSISGIRKKAAENIQLDVLHPEFRLLKRSRSFDRSSWTLDNLHARTEGFSGKAKLLYEGIFS
jgi:Holliday junction resolvasome RuvABC DNA-binding subunit